MTCFELVLSFPGGGPLIGGHSADTGGAHAKHAVDRAGRPFVPSTAIRGALRETLEALLRGDGQAACVGGDGHDPAAENTTEPERDEAAADGKDGQDQPATPPEPVPCTLDDGARCAACRLFGTRRDGLPAGERVFSGLVLGDARLDSGRVDWYDRPGVAVSRARRSAHEKSLFFHKVPVGRDLRFKAAGRLRVPELKPLLEAAARATTHVGAGRSRGLSRVEMHIDWREDEAPAPAALRADGDVHVQVTLRAPACIGTAVVERNFRDTRGEVPGATVRGAIGFALAELLGEDDDAGFQALVDGERGAHFGYLHPVDDRADTAAEIMGPLPITAAACKHEGRAHGVIDTLLDRLALALVESAPEAARVSEGALSRCERCESPLRSAAGSRRAHGPPATRTVTRVSMDRARGSARDGDLFTQVLLETGTRLEGTIRNIPDPGREALARALGSGRISLGRGAAMGWGRADIEVSQVRLPAPVRDRGEAFERALAGRLAETGLAGDIAKRLVPVTLLSPLVPPEGGEDGERLLIDELGAKRCLFKARRFTREGGWDQRRGTMEPLLVPAAGGVFVLELKGGTWRDVATRIEALERHGAGERRHQGYGQALCFDPFFLQREAVVSENAPEDARQPNFTEEQNSMDASERVRPFRKGLVMAAEEVMKGTRGSRAGKSQLNRLAAVCSEATCTAEIVNYLRYQASRQSGGESFWRLDLVKRVIEAVEEPLAKMREQLAPARDEDEVEAWRLYAVFMTRAFTYESASARPPASKAQKSERRERR